MNKKTVSLLLIILVYVLATGISYSVFSKGKQAKSNASVAATPKKTNDYGALVFDDGSKTEACPLNGVKYTTQQRKWWEGHRPLGVMIENSTDARPQSGLSFADVVYEAVAEGGITRFLAVFYCQDAGIVGPVRSARTYFLDYISEYGDSPLYTHVGGANTPGPANALGQISDYGWAGYNDMNQFSVGFPTFWRDESRAGREVATEHTMYSATNKLWDFAAKERELTNVDKKGNEWNETFEPYTFKTEAAQADRGSITSVTIPYWDYDAYVVQWNYDKATNQYLRVNGGVPHKDRNTGKQLTAKNIVVLLEKESRANDGYEGNLHMLYKDKGTGKALVYMDGKEIKATWEKDGRTGRTKLTDANGDAVKFNPGVIWFHILTDDADVTTK